MSSEKPTNEYAAMIAVLEAKKAALETAIANLRFVASGIGFPLPGSAAPTGGDAIASSATGATINSIDDIPNGSFFGKSIAEAAKLYLEMIKKKQTSKEISEALLRGGMETTSSTFATNVNTMLRRASETSRVVVRVGDSWGLPEWYHSGLSKQAKPVATARKPAKKATKTKKAPAQAKQRQAKNSGGNDAVRNDSEVEAVPRTNTSSQNEGTEGRIIAAMQGKPDTEWSAQDIEGALGIKAAVVQMLLGKIVKRGMVQKLESGKYQASRLH